MSASPGSTMTAAPASNAAQQSSSWTSVDPIVLAASIGSGPHATRHHFHHSYDNAGPGDASALAPFLFPPGAHADLCDNADASQQNHDAHVHPPTPFSGQMARSERLKLIKQQQQRILAHRRAHPHDHGHTHVRCSNSKTHDADSNQAMDSILQDVFTPSPAAPAEGHEPTPPVWEGSVYDSQQMPRSERLRREAQARKVRDKVVQERGVPARAHQQPQPHQPKLSSTESRATARQAEQTAAMASVVLVPSTAAASAEEALSANPAALRGKPFIQTLPPIQVRCHARTRVPTPHGEMFVHIYRNNHDDKEHLALVVDPAQNDAQAMEELARDPNAAKPPGHLRSRTLEEAWSPDETPLDRIVRGAYVGRLGPEYQRSSVSGAAEATARASAQIAQGEMAPLIRIHSECYTGETIGSQRCDCGEQLDEAIRLISRTGRDYADGQARGVVVYLRQEGRGIGLLDKIMAYNLQDMGADTVAANILLGHLPDLRRYDIASAILRDLGVNQCRLLTNNPEKMDALEEVGVQVTQRVAMVPRVWQRMHRHRHSRRRHGRRSQSRATSASASASVSPAPGTPAAEKIALLGSRPHGPSRLHESYTSGEGTSPPSGSALESEQEHEHDEDESAESDDSEDSYLEYALRRGGLTMLGGSVTRGPELEKYLRTKIERMGHLLELPPEQPEEQATEQISHQKRKQAHKAAAAVQTQQFVAAQAAENTGVEEQGELRGILCHTDRAASLLQDTTVLDGAMLASHVSALQQAQGDLPQARAATSDLVEWASDALANQESTPLPPTLTAALGQIVLTGTRVLRSRS